ncbi:response regulator [Pseudomonas sp. PDM14]|uniref:response regulator n=1 Tax=Pseudomonas sp. PDM14 TaxID=2769288 RepID=UPI00177D3244|nr:response regulator [Pseudomonas sp. PDM14]MBD9481621.1 response regulator [Pseudomonas sp. PDM14]
MKSELRLLIVDDNDATRYALRRRMERNGYHVQEADTGTDGLAMLARETFDALILDVNLPDMSGFDIVRQLRAEPETALLPIIHVSAASIHSGDIVTGLEAGADAYLIHPVDADVLLATLRTLLRVRDTETALRESEARFREIFSNVSAPIAVVDTQLQIVECNEAFDELIKGQSSRPLLDCFAPEQNDTVAALREHLLAGTRWSGMLDLQVAGELLETEWQVSPYGVPEHSLAFVEDVTHHRQRERAQIEQLDSATTQLALEVAERERTEAKLLQVQKMDALGKLTGGIAHDFNNLLTGIITGIELIKKRVEEGRVETITRYADAALNSANSAASMTHRLLAFARQQPLDTRPIDLNEQIRSLEELLRRTIGEHIVLHLELSTQPSVALVDPVQFESSLLNLIINARDALMDGGDIRIATFATLAHDNSRLSDGHYVALRVSDNGAGIAESVIDKVFDPFFSTKPLGKGTGLGLSTLYGFARQSGGDVSIHSVQGAGTEVTLTLPAGGEAPPTQLSRPRPTVLLQRGNGEHVLVVEDTISVSLFVAEVLQEAGYRCTQVNDVETALRTLESDMVIDLLLTDVGLPRLNGRDLALAARAMRPHLPVLFMTGYAENARDRQNFLGEGMDMLTKPFHISDLLDKVSQSLARGV